MVNVRVVFKAQLVNLVGYSSKDFNVPLNFSLRDFLLLLEDNLSNQESSVQIFAGNQLGGGILCLLNDQDIRVQGSIPEILEKIQLQEGDVITLLSFIHGG